MKVTSIGRNRCGRRIIYARPSFFEGMARVIDIGGTLNQYHIPGLEDLRAGRAPKISVPPAAGWDADVEALRSDWIVVGQCLREAMGEYGGSIQRTDVDACAVGDEQANERI